MLKITVMLSSVLFAGLAHAGNVVYEAPAVPMADAAPMAGSGSWLIPLAIIAILALTLTNNSAQPSDARLKTNIEPVGLAPNGLPLYAFRYIGGQQSFVGVMAQDVLMHTPAAVVVGPFGYMAVDYGMLGMEMQRVN